MRASILEQMDVQIFVAGEYVLTQGGRSDSFYVVVNGSATVTFNVADGHGERRIHSLSAGDYFAEAALLDTKYICLTM